MEQSQLSENCIEMYWNLEKEDVRENKYKKKWIQVLEENHPREPGDCHSERLQSRVASLKGSNQVFYYKYLKCWYILWQMLILKNFEIKFNL